MRAGLPVVVSVAVVALASSAARAAEVTLDLEPREATVGQPLALTLRLELAEGERFEPHELGPELGPFAVLDGAWSTAAGTEGDQARVWQGHVAAYELGAPELPAIELAVRGPSGEPLAVASDPATVEIVSVLQPSELESGTAEIADIKAPVSVEPDYGPLWTALILVLGLGLVAVGVGWLQRRYAARLAAAAQPVDPFERSAPDAWVFAELQRLLDRRLPEQGRVEEFYAELSRITKQYLGARYRVDLLERTTEEVGPALGDAGAPVDAIGNVQALLRASDRVKFAKDRPDEAAWRDSVERIYGIVDRTRPASTASGGARPAREGAA